MTRRRLVALAIALGSASGLGVTACSGSTASPGPTDQASTASPAIDQGISPAQARAIVAMYDSTIPGVARRRDVQATTALQTGPLLAATLAGYRASAVEGAAPTVPIAWVSVGVFVSGSREFPRRFVSFARHPQEDLRASAAVFTQARPHAPWLKSLEVEADKRYFPVPALVAGAIALPPPAMAERPSRLLASVGRYFETGAEPAGVTDFAPMQGLADQIRLDDLAVHGIGTLTVRCRPTEAVPSWTFATAEGTFELFGSITCAEHFVMDRGHVLQFRRQTAALIDGPSRLARADVQLQAQVALSYSSRAREGFDPIGVAWAVTAATGSGPTAAV